MKVILRLYNGERWAMRTEYPNVFSYMIGVVVEDEMLDQGLLCDAYKCSHDVRIYRAAK